MTRTRYSVAPTWLNFEACSYGPCTHCAAIEGPHCPCANYTTFPEYGKNEIMMNCAAKVGLDWAELDACGEWLVFVCFALFRSASLSVPI